MTKISFYPISKLFPNIVTLIGLCVGLFALKEALNGQWEKAVIFLIISAFIDGMDGGLARLLKASSNFGAQLDSLADFLSFCVVPALTIYLWKTNEIKGLGWAVALFFIICGAIRLARFNSESEEEEVVINEGKAKYFTGIPVTIGAPLSVAPMMIDFLMQEEFGYQIFVITPQFQLIYNVIIAVLMVSTLPTFSFKNVKIRKEYTSIILAVVAVLIIGMITKPWIIFPGLGILYFISLPISFWYFKK